jgi:hypothetical protein
MKTIAITIVRTYGERREVLENVTCLGDALLLLKEKHADVKISDITAVETVADELPTPYFTEKDFERHRRAKTIDDYIADAVRCLGLDPNRRIFERDTYNPDHL